MPGLQKESAEKLDKMPSRLDAIVFASSQRLIHMSESQLTASVAHRITLSDKAIFGLSELRGCQYGNLGDWDDAYKSGPKDEAYERRLLSGRSAGAGFLRSSGS